jgi:hypothetical protein
MKTFLTLAHQKGWTIGLMVDDDETYYDNEVLKSTGVTPPSNAKPPHRRNSSVF